MKRLLFFVLFTSTAIVAIADEFVVRSFLAAPTDLAAIQSGCADVNDEKCAIIKVRTDLRNLTFDTGKKLVQGVDFINGEYWLYVSPGERRISLIKEGFITLHYQIPLNIESSKVYVMVVSNQGKSGGSTGTLRLITDPPGAKVTIRELPDLQLVTPAPLENYPSFRYSINIQKTRYAEVDTIFAILPDEDITHTIVMNPLWGDIKIDVWPADASVFINDAFKSKGGRTYSGSSHGIDTGMQKISVEKEGYYTLTKIVEIVNGANEPLTFNLIPIKGFLQIDAEPKDARLFINNQLSPLPFSDSLQTGIYDIRLEREEYLTVAKKAEVFEKQRTAIKEVLPHTTTVRITSLPSQADLYRDGQLLGRTPVNVLVTFGYNNLVLKKDNYEDFIISFNVDATTDKFNFTLEPKKYKISLSSQPAEASIYVDRRPAGKTPATLSLTYGEYRIMAEKRGYFRKRKLLRVGYEDISHHFSLKPLKHMRFGVIYGEESFGGEFTWSNNLTGFTIGYYQPKKLTFDKKIDHENINTFNYINLNNYTYKEKVTNSDSLNFQIVAKVHAHLNKMPTFSITFGVALGKVAYSTVYQAGEDISSWSFGEKIYKGQYFSIANEGSFRASPIAGVSLRIFRYFYAGAEYWFNTEQGGNPYFNGGICIPLR